MPKQALVPAGAAQPPGPFSPGTKAGRLVFVSGQVAVDENRNLVGKGDIRAQTRQVLRNMQRVLESGAATFDDVVKVTIFMADVSLIEGVQEVRQEFFRPPHPASTLVEVSRLISTDWLIEIEAIAVVEQ